MAMTQEEQKAFDELKAQKEKVEEELKEKASLAAKQLDAKVSGKNDKNPTLDDLLALSEKNALEKAKIDADSKRIETAVKFNFEIERIVKENVDIVGEEIKSIVELAKQRTYSSGIEKANEIRASVLNKFFSVQENLDALATENFKTKAMEFLALAQVKRNELSAKYWELFELAVENIKKERKHAELLKSRDGNTVSTKGAEYDSKFFGMRRHYIRDNAQKS
jgi:hypothetical protein